MKKALVFALFVIILAVGVYAHVRFRMDPLSFSSNRAEAKKALNEAFFGWRGYVK